MKSAVVFTLAIGAAAMHIPWLSHHDDSRQTPMVMTEEDAVMTTHHDETRMPSGQGFHGTESGDDEIDIHVHISPSNRGANVMVSPGGSSRPGNSMGTTGEHGNAGTPSGMRTMSTNQVGKIEHCSTNLCFPQPTNCPPGWYAKINPRYRDQPPGFPESWTCCRMLKIGDPPTGPGSNTMPPSIDPQPNEMPGGGAMGGSQANPKGMQTTGSATGMDDDEMCHFVRCRAAKKVDCSAYPNSYPKIIDGCGHCCFKLEDGDGMAEENASSKSGMMSRKKSNFDL